MTALPDDTGPAARVEHMPDSAARVGPAPNPAVRADANPHPDPRAEALVNLAAFRANLDRLRAAAGPAQTMAVVKADAYGHGAAACARQARAACVPWLGAALPSEALELRAAGDRGRILTWLYGPAQDFAPVIRADVDVSAGSDRALRRIADAARRLGIQARVHLKADTGLGRGGAPAADWPALVALARRLEAEECVRITGLWSHLSCADDPSCACTARQVEAFTAALDTAQAAGLRPEVRHLANSAATLGAPQTHFDLVRPGLAAYGLSPVPTRASAAELGLVPAMTLLARVAQMKRVPAGRSVSYGHHAVLTRPTTLALVPLGYADGVPAAAASAARVLAGGRRLPITGRVAMDQFVLDVTGLDIGEGDPVVVFGPGAGGEPTAQDLARAVGTIAYEIVTRVGARVPRRWLNEDTRP